MALLHRTYSGSTRRHFLSQSNIDLTREKPVSRLVIMQARFQQRQLQEKEEKLLKLYEEQQERALQRVGAQRTHAIGPGPGKVRSLLQSRRDHGRDKSYPLEPLRGPPKLAQSQNYPEKPKRTQSLVRHPVRNAKPSSVLYFGGSHQDLRFSEELDYGQSFQVIDDQLYDTPALRNQDLDDPDDDYFVKSFNHKRQFYENRFSGLSEEGISEAYDPKVFQKLPNVGLSGSIRMSQKTETPNGKFKSYVSGNRALHGASPRSGLPTKSTPISAPTKKPLEALPPPRPRLGLTTPPARATSDLTSPPARSSQTRSARLESSSGAHVNGNTTPPRQINGNVTRKSTPPPPQGTNPTTKGGEQPRAVVPPVPASRTSVTRPSTASVPSPSKPAPVRKSLSGPAAGFSSCSNCGRNFASDRLSVHEAICRKSTNKKRKVFDPVKHRVKGTEAEKYVLSGVGSKNAQQAEKAKSATSNWRRKHEDFINNIRAAKEVQNHLKKGGRLSDLPPPPPSDYSDYVQCPHCSRKFNEAAAERHIPKCATMLHNKTKKSSPPLKASSTFRRSK